MRRRGFEPELTGGTGDHRQRRTPQPQGETGLAVSLSNRELRDALVLALVPLVAAVIGFIALIETHDAFWLGALVWIAIAFSLFEWGGITTAPWHTISKYAQIYRWLYWVIAGLAVIPLAISALYGGLVVFTLLLVTEIIFQSWWRHHIFHSVIPRIDVP